LISLEKNNHVSFKSQFLNEQFEIGNIYLIAMTKYIQMKGSSEFDKVDGNKHKHWEKITSHLRKEGYRFDFSKGGYLLNSR